MPRPGASRLPWIPPWDTGLAVAQASELMSWGARDAYVSAIQDISRAPVPKSGAGTSRPGPR
jgi:hypothetical protein